VITLSVIAIGCFFLMRSWQYSPMISVGISTLIAGVLMALTFRRPDNYSLIVSENGELKLRFEQAHDHQITANVSEKSYTTSLFCMLYLDKTPANTSSRFIIWQDSVDDKSFRRLSRIIRLISHRI